MLNEADLTSFDLFSVYLKRMDHLNLNIHGIQVLRFEFLEFRILEIEF